MSEQLGDIYVKVLPLKTENSFLKVSLTYILMHLKSDLKRS